MMQVQPEASSFRDPAGHVLYGPDDEVYRCLTPAAFELIRTFVQSPGYRQLVERECLIGTEVVDNVTQGILAEAEGCPENRYVRHDKLWFVNYPYEWTTEMLRDAARCTLTVQSLLMEQGLSLKDASAYNVQFDLSASGPTPKLIDVASLESLRDTGGVWMPYRQFVSHFMFPLLLHCTLGCDFKGPLMANLDGLNPEDVYRLVGPGKRLLPPWFTLLTLPVWLRGGGDRLKPWQQRMGRSEAVDEERVRFVMGHTIRSLQRRLDALPRRSWPSPWEDYEEKTRPYAPRGQNQKTRFVQRVCDRLKPATVLDLGCNAGTFSLLAARHGAAVLAVDSDMGSLERLYRSAREQRARVLPLRLDVINPSPALGWRGQERAAFLERYAPREAVFALALVHHLLVAKGIPLAEIVRFLHMLTERFLVIELVDVSDPMFQRLMRGRDALYAHCSLSAQEHAFESSFTIVQREPLAGMSRTVYVMEKR